MATHNVSSASELARAISSAGSGDVIRLAAGKYGTLNLSKNGVTITSASDGNKASFSHVKLNGVSNVTLDGLKFDGPGSGYGLKVAQSSNVKIKDSDFFDYQFGLHISRVTGLEVSGNDLRSMRHDGMNFAQVINAQITNNSFHDMNSQRGYTHKDMIQFWTSGAEGASRNVRIAGNRMDSPDGETHGLYMGNPQARGGNHSKFFQDIVVENNYIRTSHVHGLSVEHADGLTVRNNTLIHNKDGGKTKVINVPLINVSSASTDVDLIGNTAPSIPNGKSGWTVSGNHETGGSNLIHWNGIGGGGSRAASGPAQNAAASAETVLDTGGAGAAVTAAGASDDADTFRFVDTPDGGAGSDAVRSVDFGAGDALVLARYDGGTFRDYSGGNVVWNSADGTYVKIDSAADLKELAEASPAVSVSVNRAADEVILTIEQGSDTQRIVLEGVADEFFQL